MSSIYHWKTILAGMRIAPLACRSPWLVVPDTATGPMKSWYVPVNLWSAWLSSIDVLGASSFSQMAQSPFQFQLGVGEGGGVGVTAGAAVSVAVGVSVAAGGDAPATLRPAPAAAAWA